MSLSSAVMNQLKNSSLSPSANVKLQKKKKAWVDTINLHVAMNKYKSMDNFEIKEEKTEKDEEYKSITMVHISDTHYKHKRMRSLIPNGDILIHSGDFVDKCTWNNIEDKKTGNINNLPNEIYEFNKWIGELPHSQKIVIAGNHECCFNELNKNIISNKILTNCIYLQDDFIELYGLKIYGTPWTACGDQWGFGTNGYNDTLYSKWNNIPSCDILITHMPPYGIFDLAWQSTNGLLPPCNVSRCNKQRHNNFMHWGCYNLLSQVQNRIKPYIHYFGHVHDENGFIYDQNSKVLFINSAMDIHNICHRTKIIFDIPSQQKQQQKQQDISNNNKSVQ